MNNYKIFLTIKPENGMKLEFGIPYFTSNSNSENQKQEVLELLSKAEVTFEKITKHKE